MLSENIWYTWCKPSNYSIFGEGKSDYGQTDKSTDRIFYLRLDPFCGRGRVKITSICPSESNAVFVVPPKSNPSCRSMFLFRLLTLSSLLLSSSGHLIIITFKSQRHVLQIYLNSTSCLDFAQPLRSFGCDDQLLSSGWVEGYSKCS